MYLERERERLTHDLYVFFIDISKVLHGLIFKGGEIIFRTIEKGQHLSNQKGRHM